MKVDAVRRRSSARALRGHYSVLRSVFPKLPPVEIEFARLRKAIADVTVYGNGRNPRIRIHENLKWSHKLCVHELLHETVHLLKPNLEHGEKFEREIIKIKRVVCADGDSW